ncbi:MAG: 2-succinyl-5-enolpyruvyl-6-hydroxy-3-cyclohexene-1-carboxylic-acid synthase [Prochlorococcaceae cyanobacterium]
MSSALSQAEITLQRALGLLASLRSLGLGRIVLCPGSRSAPLAVAAALLEGAELELLTAIDERSAAFFALALGRADGVPAAVICTSGTAVANLLPAAVEADFGAIPLLLISADRPARLKACGANQTVNQETFLATSCRWLGQADPAGLHASSATALEQLAQQAWRACLGSPPGPVHLNLAIEEPLHAEGAAIRALQIPPAATAPPLAQAGPESGSATLDPGRPALVVAGPWRGAASQWQAYAGALARLQRATGWPLLADQLSGLRGLPGLAALGGYDLILDRPPATLAPPQVLRLGPLPASRRLQNWLARLEGPQLLISEGEPRCLDPLGRLVRQEPAGLAAWVDGLLGESLSTPVLQPAPLALELASRWRAAEAALQAELDRQLPGHGRLNEPALARWLSRWLPAGLPLMLANSSPVRDWESFADPQAPARPVYGFRGASGIDGTLSQACGLAHALGGAVLVSGDLALLHDSNGWLWQRQLRGRLTVLLIDNAGGGIFEQLPIRPQPQSAFDFERLFAMPQAPDPLQLAACHGVPGRRLLALEQLPAALAWALEQPLALLQLCTDRRLDARWRQQLRRRMPMPTAPSR